MSNITIIFSTTLLVSALLLFYQAQKMWKLRVLMKNFRNEIRSLNMNLDNINIFLQSKDGTEKEKQIKHICKNCEYRNSYIESGTPSVFNYKCKLDDRIVALDDSCKRFKKDLLNSEI